MDGIGVSSGDATSVAMDEGLEEDGLGRELEHVEDGLEHS